jgi:hypothetical protein
MVLKFGIYSHKCLWYVDHHYRISIVDECLAKSSVIYQSQMLSEVITDERVDWVRDSIGSNPTLVHGFLLV